MRPRNPPGFWDSGIVIGGGLDSESRLERVYRRLQVVNAAVHIFYWFAVGGFLMLVPWLRFWDHNALLYHFPGLIPIVGNAFLKGAVLGLGIVNLLIGLHELLHFGDRRR